MRKTRDRRDDNGLSRRGRFGDLIEDEHTNDRHCQRPAQARQPRAAAVQEQHARRPDRKPDERERQAHLPSLVQQGGR